MARRLLYRLPRAITLHQPNRGVKMIAINTINWNGEIWRKILNSVAGKYDCGVNFNIHSGQLDFEGDRHCAEEIVREVMDIFAGAN